MKWSDMKPKRRDPDKELFSEQLRRDVEQFYREAAEYLDRKVGKRKPEPTLFEEELSQ